MNKQQQQNIDLKKAIIEKEYRIFLESYKNDLPKFCVDHVKILPKDTTLGTVPMVFNEAQTICHELIEKQFKETGRVRVVILKSRQQGISTYVIARVFMKNYFRALTKTVVIAHDRPTSTSLFGMTKRIIEKLDDRIKPEVFKDNQVNLEIKRRGSTDMSDYTVFTAGSATVGRGTTPTVLHCSETAFWDNADVILSGLFQGVPNNNDTEIIIESTANGAAGAFYDLWKKIEKGQSDYIGIFIPWFVTKEYSIPHTEKFKNNLSEDDKIYQAKFGLTLDQMYWRQLKIDVGGPDSFKQEYPATSDEAFLISGTNVFDTEILSKFQLKGYTDRSTFDIVVNSFVPSLDGELKTWGFSNIRSKYIIGVDVALGVNQDYSAAIVINDNLEVCAYFSSNKIDPGMLGYILFYLGRYYNNALLAVESNNHGIATLLKLKEMNYMNLYKQVNISDISNDENKRLGFRTTSSSKPAIIGGLKNLIENPEEDRKLEINSIEIIEELRSYVSDGSGKTNAVKGKHDDAVMALAIATEVYRSHGNRLTSNRIPLNETFRLEQQHTNWI